MSGDVTPESLRALAERHSSSERVTVSGDHARLHLDTADALRQVATRITEMKAAETKLARVREWFVDTMEDEALTWSRLEAILDDTEGGKR